MRRPMGWVVQYRRHWYDTALLGCGVLIGLFFAVISLGAFGFVVMSSLEGTLLAPAERSGIAIGKYTLIALLALCFGSFSLRWSLGSLMDLVGAEVVLFGPVEELTVHRGSRGRCYGAVVAGGTVALSSNIFATLAKGDQVWMRVGRFQRSLKELARPDRSAPPRRQVQPGAGTTAARAAAPPPVVTAASPASGVGERAGARGPIADEALRLSDVPAPTARWTEVERFALSWDGAAGPELSALFERHEQAPTLPDSLSELRAILFREQRRHRHFMRAPSGEALARVRAIVEAIRARVPPDA